MVLRQGFYFLFIGVVATLVHLLIAMLGHKSFDLAPQIANLAGFNAAVLVSYFGHAKLTFRIVPDHSFHLPRFIVVSLCGLVVSSAITHFGNNVLEVPFTYTMVMVAVSVPPITFALLKFWAFSMLERK